jgi:polyhydroxybutyrate depolymerase
MIAAVFFSTVSPAADSSAQDASFPDLADTWFRYKDSIAYLRERNVLNGYPDGTFKPKQTLNRAELLKIVFRGRSSTDPVGGDCFSDVKESDWFAPYVCAAKRRSIVSGYEDGSFRPEQPVNFAEAIKMMLLAYGNDIEERPGVRWYEPYAAELDKLRVLPRNSYIPWEPLTRERAADMIARFIRFDEERIIPNESAGCGKAARDVSQTITVNGIERSFLLTVPDTISNRNPAPLIVAFHGRTNSNERVRSYFGLDREADDYFIAYPAAIKKDNGTFTWSDGNDKPGAIRDVALFDAIVETLGKHYCIDMDRIYTVGHSLGAWMANSVACIRGGIVHGSATVGGDSILTNCAGPAAALMIHHQRDNLASFASAEKARDQRLKENVCPEETTPSEPETLQCKTYTGCDGGNTVVWCPHEVDTDRQGNHYPHQWPEGTAQAMLKFFDGL